MTSAQTTQLGKKPELRMVKLNYPEVELTPQQKRQWSETLAAVNWIGPGFTHLLYTMLNKRGDSQVALFTEAIPCAAATDGIQLLFKPSEFFALTLMERVFAVFHEISHCVGDHCGMGYQMKKRGEIIMGNKKLPYDPMLSNYVQDYIINDMLIESQFGTFKKGWLHDRDIATYKDDWVEVYFKQYKKPPKPPPGNKPGNKPGQGQGQQGQQGQGPTPPGNQPGEGQGQTQPGPGQFDQHLDPGQIEDKTPEEVGPRDAQQWQQAVAEALEVARAQGKCPAAFEMHFGAMLEPKVDWTEHLRALVARKVGSGGFDFRRPDRRLIVRDIGCPGRSGHGAGVVVLALDTSGSIFGDPTLIDRWMGELTGIMQDVRPKELHVVECDATVQRVTELNDVSDIAEIAVMKGGGGTSFVPVFEWIEEQGFTPDALLYLTDSYGDFPKEAPKYPVIWGDISGEPQNYPWGDVVEVPTE
jgi:predicted metal-dependent peptidase